MTTPCADVQRIRNSTCGVPGLASALGDTTFKRSWLGIGLKTETKKKNLQVTDELTRRCRFRRRYHALIRMAKLTRTRLNTRVGAHTAKPLWKMAW